MFWRRNLAAPIPPEKGGVNLQEVPNIEKSL